MKAIEDVIIPRNSGKSFTLKKGQRIRISAESVVDFACFNLHNLRERFDQARTKTNQRRVFISTGHKLYSKFNNPMMAILEDTYRGTHDMQYGTCSKSGYDEWWQLWQQGAEWLRRDFEMRNIKKREDLPDHGCWENFQQGLEGYNIAPEDMPSPFNIFQGMEITPEGRILRMIDKYHPELGKPDHMDLRAEMDLLVVVSACPEMDNKGKEVWVTKYG